MPLTSEASLKYKKEKFDHINIVFKEKDADVLTRINSASSKQGYVKSLILKDLHLPDDNDYSFSDKASSSSKSNVLGLSLIHTVDAPIIERLQSVPNKREYIAALVRADLAGAQSESWHDIAARADIDGLLIALEGASSTISEVSEQISDQTKKNVLSRLNGQITDTLQVIRTGLQLSEK